MGRIAGGQIERQTLFEIGETHQARSSHQIEIQRIDQARGIVEKVVVKKIHRLIHINGQKVEVVEDPFIAFTP